MIDWHRKPMYDMYGMMCDMYDITATCATSDHPARYVVVIDIPSSDGRNQMPRRTYGPRDRHRSRMIWG